MPEESRETQIATLSKLLMEMLEKTFGDEEIYDTIAPIIPALVELGISEGLDAAEGVLLGLGKEDSYPYWQKLISASLPARRIQIMETTRQAAILDKLNKIKKDEKRWEVFIGMLKFAVSICIALLI